MQCLGGNFQPRMAEANASLSSKVSFFGFVLLSILQLYRPFYGLEFNGSTMQFALLLFSANSRDEP